MEQSCSIFINYRTSDAGGYARLLYYLLQAHFGEGAIFFDRSTIRSGDDFPEALRRGVEGCAVFLVVMTRRWLEESDAKGRKLLDNKNDWVRREIALAFARDKPMIPILFEDAPLPQKDALPVQLKRLANLDVHRMGGKTYEYEVQQRRLIERLKSIPGVPSPRADLSLGLSTLLSRVSPESLSDRSEQMFGREPDIQAISDRLHFKGLTAVVARARMGKSWLLKEVARRFGESRCLVGFFENSGASDPTFRAIQDLYARWLSGVDRAERPGLIDRIAAELSEVFDEEPAGGFSLNPLRSDQARRLVATASKLSGRRVVLIVDAWEKTRAPQADRDLLDAFLTGLDKWPECHIVLALRAPGAVSGQPDEHGLEHVKALVNSRRGHASVYELGEMQLSPAESERMLAYLRRNLLVIGELDSSTLLRLIGGYPGVIDSWLAPGSAGTLQTPAALMSAAEAAQQSRYPDLPRLLEPLEKEALQIAIRVALLPTAASADGWSELQSAVVRDLDEALLDDLARAGVLQGTEPPSFGHATRAEAVLTWFVSQQRTRTRRELTGLVVELASRFETVSPNTRRVADGIMALRSTCAQLKAEVDIRGLCEAAATTLSDDYDRDLLLQAADAARMNDGPGAPLLALGLANAHAHAFEHARTAPSSNVAQKAGAEDIFIRIQELSDRHPGVMIFQRRLAQAFLNRALAATSVSLEDAQDAQRDERYRLQDDSFDQLSALAKSYPKEATFRAYLSHGLTVGLRSACSAINLILNPAADAERRDALLLRLRTLAIESPDDRDINSSVAFGILAVLNDANGFARNVDLRDALVEELMALSEHSAVYPPGLWGNFAIGLLEMSEQDIRGGAIESARGFLRRLRTLAERVGIPTIEQRLREALELLHNVGYRCIELKRHEFAISLLEEQVILARTVGNQTLEGEGLANMAVELDHCDRREAALNKMREAAQVFQDLPDPTFHVRAMRLIKQWEDSASSS